MMPQAQIVELLKVQVTEGEGTEESPKRAVDYYFQPSGVLLWRWDEWEEEQTSDCVCTRCVLRYGKEQEG